MQVHVVGEPPSSLAQLLGGLVRSNAEADPQAARLLEVTRGAVQLDVPDADKTIGLRFAPGALTVSDGPVPGADLRLVADSATLMGLSTAPLRMGLPDPLHGEGRAVLLGLLTRRVRVGGLPGGLGLLRTLTRLLHVG